MPSPPTDIIELQQALTAYTQNGNSYTRAAESIGLPYNTLRGRVVRAREAGILPDVADDMGVPSPLPTAPKITLSESELRERIDGAYRLESRAVKLREGEYMEESEILRELHLVGRINRTLLDTERFMPYRGRSDNGGKYYWGHPKSIARLKAERLLR